MGNSNRNRKNYRRSSDRSAYQESQNWRASGGLVTTISNVAVICTLAVTMVINAVNYGRGQARLAESMDHFKENFTRIESVVNKNSSRIGGNDTSIAVMATDIAYIRKSMEEIMLARSMGNLDVATLGILPTSSSLDY